MLSWVEAEHSLGPGDVRTFLFWFLNFRTFDSLESDCTTTRRNIWVEVNFYIPVGLGPSVYTAFLVHDQRSYFEGAEGLISFTEAMLFE